MAIPVETPNEPAAAAMRDFLGIIPTEDLPAVASPDGTEKVAVLAGVNPGFMTAQEIADLGTGGASVYPSGLTAPNLENFSSFSMANTNTGAQTVFPFGESMQNAASVIFDNTDSIGIARLSTNANAAARANITGARFTPGAGLTYKIKGRVRWSDAFPNGTDTFHTFFGHNSTFGIPTTQMAGFQLRWTGSAVVFEAVTRAAGTQDTTVLTTPTLATWYVLEVIFAPASVTYYINGVLVATHTNAPTTVGQLPVGIVKTAGTNNRRYDIDWLAERIA